MDLITLYTVTIVIFFISTFTRSAIGFGDGVIAMPLLAIVMGVRTATPLVALVACVISIAIVYKNRMSIDTEAVRPLVISSVMGIPIGLLMLKGVSEDLMKIILGCVIAAYGLYGLARPPMASIGNRKEIAFIYGFIAGILGGAYNVAGIIIAMYGAMRRWPPQQFRATMHSYFLISGFFIKAGHAVSGLWTTRVFGLFSLALPGVLLAIYLGGKINRRLIPGTFERYVHGFLMILGIILVVRSAA